MPMTPLDQTASDRPQPAATAAGASAECSVAAAAGPGGAATTASVPQPRLAAGRRQEPANGRADGRADHPVEDGTDGRAESSAEDSAENSAEDGADSGAALIAGPSAVTARNLRAGLGVRLRSAYERGATIAELSVACRRTDAETRELLLTAGTDLSPEVRRNPRGPRNPANPANPAQRSAESTARAAGPAGRPPAAGEPAPEPGTAGRRNLPAPPVPPAGPASGSAPAVPLPKRPSPARRLSRLHPREGRPGDVPQQRSASLPDRSAASTGAPDPTSPTGHTGLTGPTGPGASQTPSETPLGILIGGTPNLPEPENRPRERRYVRVDARLLRAGRGTCLVVLPSWRSAIAVSVPTEQLIAATGLGFEQLPDAVLSVFIDPEALHDRELGLHGWRTGPAKRGAARARRK
ncbi:hypothetical protein [Kitasatospora sp. NPDC057015]|uniref:hypothetical protein n=1 Tax=Kitasatospora sp. NPDC057015 TaxID=3346001 RepID=UPI0036398942